MTELERLSKELRWEYIKPIPRENTWLHLAKHVQRMILKARMDELDIVDGRIVDGDFHFAKEERIAELTKQIDALKEKLDGK